jgi:Leucine Rich repeat
MPRLSFPACAASGRIQSDSTARTVSSDTTLLLAEPWSRGMAHRGRRRAGVLLLQGAWPWRLRPAWLEGFARFGGSFFHYERWPRRAWQLSLMGALIYDVVQYADYPQARFGNTLTNVLFGFGANPETVSRHWGSDRPPEALFWLAPGVLVSLSLLSVLRAACYRPLPRSALAPSDDKPLAFHQADALRAVSDGLFFGNGLSDEDALALINNLGQTSLASRFPLNYRAIAILASFAGRERDGAQEDRAQATEQAMTHLTFHLDARRPWLRRVYTGYHLWRQGLDSNGSVDGVWPYAFGLWVLCQFAVGLFSRYHYWRLLGDKLTDVLDYHDRQAACEALDKQFFYAAWPDQAVCALCPDWDFVRLADSDGLQACVEGLLQQPLPPEDLARRLTRLQGHAGLTRVDLSGYAWAYAWSAGEFAQVLEALQALLKASPEARLQRLDVSNGLRQTGVVSPLTLQALATFIEQAKPRELRMRDYRLGPTRWPIVLPALVNHTAQLDVSMSDIGDAGVLNMTALLPGSALTGFIARDSGLSDSSAWALHDVWLDCVLTSLVVADNALTAEGLTTLAVMFGRRPGVRLDVSGMLLSAPGARRFWPVVRHVEQLIVRDCGLREAAVIGLGPWLVNSTLRVLDMAHNPLADGAIWALAPDVLAAKVREWRLAHTWLSSRGLAHLGERLPLAAYLRVLDVSGCALGDGSASFFAGALQSSLHTLRLNAVGLTPGGLAHLTDAFGRYRHTPLRALTLAGNAMDSFAAAAFIEAVGESACCHRLSLSGTGLNDTVLPAMGALLGKERLQILQLRENRLTSLSALVPHGRSLQVLDVADNALTGTGMMAWAQASLEAMAYFADLGEGTLTRAQRRDFSTLSATGALRLWDVSGHRLEDGAVRTLCRVAEQAGYAVMTDGAGAAPRGAAHSTLRLFQTSPTGSKPAAAASMSRSTSLSGVGTPLWCALLLSLLWLLRCCGVGRTRAAFTPVADVSLRVRRG